MAWQGKGFLASAPSVGNRQEDVNNLGGGGKGGLMVHTNVGDQGSGKRAYRC